MSGQSLSSQAIEAAAGALIAYRWMLIWYKLPQYLTGVPDDVHMSLLSQYEPQRQHIGWLGSVSVNEERIVFVRLVCS